MHLQCPKRGARRSGGFKAGPQPAAKFDIHGVDTCPEDPQCNAPPAQLRRLMARQYHTFARYQTMF